MNRLFSRSILQQIEVGTLSSRTSLTDLLRKCIALGGRSGSVELRDWARRELDGYRGDEDELPAYRWVNAPLLVDGMHGHWQFERKRISAMELPDFARDAFAKGLAMKFGVAELERMAAKSEPTGLQPAGMDDLAYFMNGSADYGVTVHRVYFSLSPVAAAAVLDSVCTNLVSLVAEIRSTGISDRSIPSAAVADDAYNVVIKGRTRANIAIGDGAAATMHTEEGHSEKLARPTWLTAPWTLLVGAMTIMGGIAGIATWLQWSSLG